MASLIVLLFADCALAATRIAIDPTELSVGARVLGLGRAYSAIADDPAAIFLNPAGLGQIERWQFSSMSGKYLNVFNYVQLAAVWPTRFGAFGFGYGGSATDFSFPSSEVVTIGDQRRIVATGEVTGSYDNTALLLAYGGKFSLGRIENLYLGAALKLLSQKLTASVFSGGAASGRELDLGLLIPVNKDLSAALTWQNMLPSDAGGKITWADSQHEEVIPAMLKIGLNYRLLRRQSGDQQDLTLAIDYDYNLSVRNYPLLSHAGLEWSPTPFLALRFGSDQSLGVDENGLPTAANDLAFGVSLLFNDFRFDYAHHNYFNLADNATNYFSLSYGIKSETLPARPAEASLPGSDFHDATFQPDKEVLKVDFLTALRQLAAASTNEASRLFPFEKITVTLTEPLTRAEAVVLMIQFLGWELPPVRERPYSDIQARHWAINEISIAKERNLLQFISGDFQPDKHLTRAEMAALLSEIAEEKHE